MLGYPYTRSYSVSLWHYLTPKSSLYKCICERIECIECCQQMGARATNWNPRLPAEGIHSKHLGCISSSNLILPVHIKRSLNIIRLSYNVFYRPKNKSRLYWSTFWERAAWMFEPATKNQWEGRQWWCWGSRYIMFVQLVRSLLDTISYGASGLNRVGSAAFIWK